MEILGGGDVAIAEGLALRIEQPTAQRGAARERDVEDLVGAVARQRPHLRHMVGGAHVQRGVGRFDAMQDEPTVRIVNADRVGIAGSGPEAGSSGPAPRVGYSSTGVATNATASPLSALIAWPVTTPRLLMSLAYRRCPS